MPRLSLLLLVACLAVLAPSGTAQAATCGDYPNQAEAQRAADTRDPDADGIYCENLPCPCLRPSGTSPPPSTPPATTPRRTCSRPATVQQLKFSATKYANIKRHTQAAIASGWPRILVVNRPGSHARRDRLLEGIPTTPGFDRDEYPPAVGRGRPNGNLRGLVRGINPVGWMADVMYVESSENRSHGSSLGGKLRRFCNGTRFRYVFV